MTEKAPPTLADLEAVQQQLAQTQYVLRAVIAQRDDAMNKLADATATIAILQAN